MILDINRFVDPLVKLLGEDFLWLSELTIGSVLIRLLLIVLFSGMIGIERASKRHEAGLRTYILVCIGAAVAMLTNQFIFEAFNTGDVGRIAAQVISGIGFLGALGIVFITLKLLKVIDWSWWWVLSPIWIPVVIFLIACVIYIFKD